MKNKIFLLFLFVSFLSCLPWNSFALKDEVIYQGNDVIWGFDFINQNEVLLTERSGSIKYVNIAKKEIREFPVPFDVFRAGQGGLLDLKLHPDFKNNHLVYFTYSKKLPKGQATTALASFSLVNGEAKDFKEHFVANAAGKSGIQFGSRIVWDKSGNLFMTIGDRDERDKAQDLSVHNGKILRIDAEKKVSIWSYGHRNPQGIDIDPTTGDLYSTEFGPRGGDEVNLIQKNKNYGWPVITYGREYSGPKIGEGIEKKGMEQPIIHWEPSISPSGMAFYRGDKFPQWKNNLFLACLSGMHLRRLQIVNQKVVAEESILADKFWRIRQVQSGPDGYLYISTDSGSLVKLKPN